MLDSSTLSSNRKRVYLGKAVTSSSSTICVPSSPDDAPEPASTHGKKYIENFNKLDKEVYFRSKGVLKGQVIHPEVREYTLIM